MTYIHAPKTAVDTESVIPRLGSASVMRLTKGRIAPSGFVRTTVVAMGGAMMRHDASVTLHTSWMVRMCIVHIFLAPFNSINGNILFVSHVDCSKSGCDLNCNYHGDCEKGLCKCYEGWGGFSCETRICLEGCTDHGVCNSDGTCTCKRGWSGENCKIHTCETSDTVGGLICRYDIHVTIYLWIGVYWYPECLITLPLMYVELQWSWILSRWKVSLCWSFPGSLCTFILSYGGKLREYSVPV